MPARLSQRWLPNRACALSGGSVFISFPPFFPQSAALGLVPAISQYLIKGGEVIIVDESTGRLMVGRRWSDGLHQAVEAKEGVKIQNETLTLASVSYQNFFLR